jgi:hypothetical protein
MTSPRHHSMGSVTDPHPVRPGTSADLTARTIDATVHPPIVRAQEAVAAFIPRVEAPLRSVGSPILIGMFGATLVLLWVAHRVRFRPTALVFSAMLMVMLTSFHPLPQSTSARPDERPTTTRSDPRDQASNGDVDQQESQPATIDDDDSQPEMTMPEVEQPEMPEIEVSPDLIARVIPTAELMRMDREMMRHDRDKLRASLQQLAIEVRKEARRNARRYYKNW